MLQIEVSLSCSDIHMFMLERRSTSENNYFLGIQFPGPPGCGKTHMGLAIVATLLMNTDSQILIVSHTNHALDQFLTGILKYTDSNVRVGNQSRNEHLDSFNIKNMCEIKITDKRIKSSLFKLNMAYSEAVQEFQQLQNSENVDCAFEKYEQIQVYCIIYFCYTQLLYYT